MLKTWSFFIKILLSFITFHIALFLFIFFCVCSFLASSHNFLFYLVLFSECRSITSGSKYTHNKQVHFTKNLYYFIHVQLCTVSLCKMSSHEAHIEGKCFFFYKKIYLLLFFKKKTDFYNLLFFFL